MGITVVDTRVAANTSTGNQDIDTADLGGLTPKAVMLIVTRALAEDTPVDGAGVYWGLSDGTNEATGSYEAEHNQANMDIQSDQVTTADRILNIYNGAADSTVDATADFVSFHSNGVRINWTDAPASAFLITAVFFAGSDLSAAVFRQDLGNTADALIGITSIGFEADDVVCFWNHSLNQGGLGVGVIHNDRAGTVTQRAVTHVNRNGFGTSNAWAVMRSGDCIIKIQATGGLDYNGSATSFTSSGFSVQLGNARAPANADIAGLALRYGSSPVVSSKVYTYSTPTSTGSNTDSGAGFQPQFVLYLLNRTATAGTIETDADAGTIGILVVDEDGDVISNTISDEDAAPDSNTQSLSSSYLNLPTHTGAAGQGGDWTSMGASGITWNWTGVDATARQWAALAIGANPAATKSLVMGERQRRMQSLLAR